MNIYLISQDINIGYDTYDSAVVIAKDKESARKMHPANTDGEWTNYEMGTSHTWVSFDDISEVHVQKIGTAISNVSQVILASFNAG